MADRITHRCDGHFITVRSTEEFDSLSLDQLNPRYIFFLHWSSIIPASIFRRYETVIFHITDVPYGRGGSPLQNLIVRGHENTVISAIRCTKELDAGPVYAKRPLCLHGSAEEIFIRARDIIEDMIVEIIENEPIPTPQRGTPVIFRRRKAEDGNLQNVRTLKEVYDWIRMLDAPGYPPAFLDVGPFRILFRRATMHFNKIRADVEIVRRPEDASDG